MAPSILSDAPTETLPSHNGKVVTPESAYPAPLKNTGTLDGFAFEETTPVIGREFPSVNIVDDILNSPNADDLLRDLAITSTSGPGHPLFSVRPPQ